MRAWITHHRYTIDLLIQPTGVRNSPWFYDLDISSVTIELRVVGGDGPQSTEVECTLEEYERWVSAGEEYLADLDAVEERFARAHGESVHPDNSPYLRWRRLLARLPGKRIRSRRAFSRCMEQAEQLASKYSAVQRQIQERLIETNFTPPTKPASTQSPGRGAPGPKGRARRRR